MLLECIFRNEAVFRKNLIKLRFFPPLFIISYWFECSEDHNNTQEVVVVVVVVVVGVIVVVLVVVVVVVVVLAIVA